MYAHLTFGKQSHVTPIVRHTLNPYWNDSVFFKLDPALLAAVQASSTRSDGPVLKVSLFHKNKLFSDTCLGAVVVGNLGVAARLQRTYDAKRVKAFTAFRKRSTATSPSSSTSSSSSAVDGEDAYALPVPAGDVAVRAGVLVAPAAASSSSSSSAAAPLPRSGTAGSGTSHAGTASATIGPASTVRQVPSDDTDPVAVMANDVSPVRFVTQWMQLHALRQNKLLQGQVHVSVAFIPGELSKELLHLHDMELDRRRQAALLRQLRAKYGRQLQTLGLRPWDVGILAGRRVVNPAVTLSKKAEKNLLKEDLLDGFDDVDVDKEALDDALASSSAASSASSSAPAASGSLVSADKPPPSSAAAASGRKSGGGCCAGGGCCGCACALCSTPPIATPFSQARLALIRAAKTADARRRRTEEGKKDYTLTVRLQQCDLSCEYLEERLRSEGKTAPVWKPTKVVGLLQCNGHTSMVDLFAVELASDARAKRVAHNAMLLEPLIAAGTPKPLPPGEAWRARGSTASLDKTSPRARAGSMSGGRGLGVAGASAGAGEAEDDGKGATRVILHPVYGPAAGRLHVVRSGEPVTGPEAAPEQLAKRHAVLGPDGRELK